MYETRHSGIIKNTGKENVMAKAKTVSNDFKLTDEITVDGRKIEKILKSSIAKPMLMARSPLRTTSNSRLGNCA